MTTKYDVARDAIFEAIDKCGLNEAKLEVLKHEINNCLSFFEDLDYSDELEYRMEAK